MTRMAGAAGLALLALLMFVGFLNRETAASAGAVAAAFGITVVLPAAGALLLARSHIAERGRLAGRRAALARQATESQLLRLARLRGGKLMSAEAAMAMHLSEDVAREALDAMVTGGRAELEVTDGGSLVYAFPTLAQLADKGTVRGILDA